MKSRRDVMSINLEKRVFSPKEATFIIDQLKRAEETGYVESRTENSRYLLASFRGSALHVMLSNVIDKNPNHGYAL